VPLPKLRLLKKAGGAGKEVEHLPRGFASVESPGAHLDQAKLPPCPARSPSLSLPPRGRSLLKPLHNDSGRPPLPRSPSPAPRPSRLAPLAPVAPLGSMAEHEDTSLVQVDFAAELQRKSRERAREFKKEMRRKQQDEEDRRKEEERERQERALKLAPQVEAHRRELSRRAAELFRREREGKQQVAHERAEIFSERKEKMRRYLTPESIRQQQQNPQQIFASPHAERRHAGPLPPLPGPPRRAPSTSSSPIAASSSKNAGAGSSGTRGRRAQSSPRGASRRRGQKGGAVSEAEAAPAAVGDDTVPPKDDDALRPSETVEQNLAQEADGVEKSRPMDEESAVHECRQDQNDGQDEIVDLQSEAVVHSSITDANAAVAALAVEASAVAVACVDGSPAPDMVDLGIAPGAEQHVAQIKETDTAEELTSGEPTQADPGSDLPGEELNVPMEDTTTAQGLTSGEPPQGDPGSDLPGEELTAPMEVASTAQGLTSDEPGQGGPGCDLLPGEELVEPMEGVEDARNATSDGLGELPATAHCAVLQHEAQDAVADVQEN